MENSKGVFDKQKQSFNDTPQGVFTENNYRTSREVLADVPQNVLQIPFKGSSVAKNENMYVRADGSVTADVSVTGSILKRLRRNSVHGIDKENLKGNSLLYNTYNNTNTHFQKRVKIISPQKDIFLKSGSSVYNRPTLSSMTNMPKDTSLSREVEEDDDFKDPIPKNNVSMIKFGCPAELKDHKVHVDTQINRNVLGVTVCGVTKIRRRNKKDFEHWLLVRYQPKVLSDAVRSLSPNQRKWVKTTGFGSILSFRMNQYPQGLSYYIANSFQPLQTSLCFDRITIPITDDDVNEVLGLPKGSHDIQIMKSTHIDDLWREQFKSLVREGWKITANMVCDVIKNSTEVDRLFKLNFLVLLYNVVIEGPTNPYVRQTILGFTGDLDHCNKYNWCSYLISHLRNASIGWTENPTTKFYTGSIPFLVYLYMDRVVNGTRKVRRKKPTFVGWSDSLILDRQISDISSKTFFHGKIAMPLRTKDSDDESSFEDNTWNNNDTELSESEEVEGRFASEEDNIAIVYKNCLLENINDDFLDIKESEANDDTNIRKESSNSGKHSVSEDTNTSKTLALSNYVDNSSMESLPSNHHPGTEVPQFVIDELKESVNGYENLQRKCMMYLLSATKLFKNNSIVSSMEKKFIQLIEEATEFVRKELHDNVICQATSSNKVKVGKKDDPVIHGLKSPLDEDLCLSTQDWMFIDSCSVDKSLNPIGSKEIINNMESQSKTLSLIKSKRSDGFKTPGEEQTFKVRLDATIPSFNILNDGVEKVDTLSHGTDNKPEEATILYTSRPKREKKLPDVKKSPFIDRFTDIHGKTFRKEESDLWDWLHSDERYPNRILFQWGDIKCFKTDFQSMQVGELVMASVLDVWCVFLNSQEKLRAPGSPRRLYCYTETTLGTLNGFNEKTIKKKYDIFEENMDHILRTHGVKLEDIDLVFFPIFIVNHYYVVCYNLKNPAVDILDNRSSERSVKAIYGHQLDVLQKHFISYMKAKHIGKVMELSRMVPERIKMHWQTKENHVDCGVFAMRHMETYFGGGARTWCSKIAVESYTQKRQMIKLRVLFTYRMLSSPLNCFYPVIKDEIKDPSLLPEDKSLLVGSQKLKK